MKNERIRVVIKEPGQDPERRTIANNLRALQNIVGGYIETVTISETIGGAEARHHLRRRGRPQGERVQLQDRGDSVLRDDHRDRSGGRRVHGLAGHTVRTDAQMARSVKTRFERRKIT